MLHPAATGFHMPAEWDQHVGCWMAWPVREATFPNGLAAARAAYAAVARAISGFEPVAMLCPASEFGAVRALCGPGVIPLAVQTSDSWLRDNGPSFLTHPDGRRAGVHWQFNAWGGNYSDYGPDQAVGRTILDHLGLDCFPAPLIMEGGAFHVDGQGTLLTTEQCLLNPNRNPNLDRKQIEQLLAAFLGVRQFIWLGQGYEEDETDGHIDEIACFVKPGTVLTLTTDDRSDPNWAVFQDNLERLSMARDAGGRELDIITLRTPERQEQNGVRLTLSYTNFYLANGGVLLPTFDDPADAAAIAVFRRLFPDRTIVTVPALDIVRGGGGIHCITQQQPA
jgi:agmatine deiminase